MPTFIRIARRFLRDEPNRLSGAWMAIVVLVLYARRRLGLPETPITVKPSAPNGAAVRVRVWNWIDILVVRELFLDTDYRIPPYLEPRTILDLGANIGVSVVLFRALYPSARVIAVEPDGTQFGRLARQIAGDPAVELVQGAATPRPGPVPFFEAEDGWLSSLHRPRGKAIKRTVEGKPIADILAQAGLARVDLLKLDIEGGEWDLLEAGSIQQATGCIIGELHHQSGRSLQEALDLLEGWKFEAHAKKPSQTTFTAER